MTRAHQPAHLVVGLLHLKAAFPHHRLRLSSRECELRRECVKMGTGFSHLRSGRVLLHFHVEASLVLHLPLLIG